MIWHVFPEGELLKLCTWHRAGNLCYHEARLSVIFRGFPNAQLESGVHGRDEAGVTMRQYCP